jgi:hypothetical protein
MRNSVLMTSLAYAQRGHEELHRENPEGAQEDLGAPFEGKHARSQTGTVPRPFAKSAVQTSGVVQWAPQVVRVMSGVSGRVLPRDIAGLPQDLSQIFRVFAAIDRRH